jgi:hypothetical protein
MFGAVSGCEERALLALRFDFSRTALVAVANLVRFEELRSQHVTPAMPLAAICVDPNLHAGS